MEARAALLHKRSMQDQVLASSQLESWQGMSVADQEHGHAPHPPRASLSPRAMPRWHSRDAAVGGARPQPHCHAASLNGRSQRTAARCDADVPAAAAAADPPIDAVTAAAAADAVDVEASVCTGVAAAASVWEARASGERAAGDSAMTCADWRVRAHGVGSGVLVAAIAPKTCGVWGNGVQLLLPHVLTWVDTDSLGACGGRSVSTSGCLLAGLGWRRSGVRGGRKACMPSIPCHLARLDVAYMTMMPCDVACPGLLR
eukprot:354114-Chlamydomonas_euryale.AAC.3